MNKLTSEKKILIIGAAVIDVLVNVPVLPKSGEDISGELQGTVVGGSAYNVRQAVESLGIKNVLFVPVGNGIFAEIIKKEFAKKRIPIVLNVQDGENGWDVSFVEPNGERTFLTIPGIETKWQSDWFEQINIKDYDYFYVSGYELEGKSGEVILDALSMKKAGSKILFDASPRVRYLEKSIVQRLLTRDTIIHCNADEIKLLAPECDNIESAANRLQKKTNDIVLVTLGANGTYFNDGANGGIVSGEKVKVVDTIGAGDSHSGAFLCGLAAGMTTFEAVQLANRLSAKVVSQRGGAIEQ
ncbi:PfkB family carbohydrate kinase [Sporolactobacillus sp. CQH2019]|uniref:PfkB family carbohydrate kinase n=1 Tax=Sporolactobacillus sp. CQH2019 TaxID=3023512 RepID=UPI002367E5C6|nr:PfkB family carbohydrate kinase [Sporolactobacillus sp. CQH2019]MDD9149352.1 PfkB family carbohydrate kinase [Sporolactobacillus sp. CQH2019]